MCVWIISGLIFWGSFFVCLFCLFVCLERDAHTDTTKKKRLMDFCYIFGHFFEGFSVSSNPRSSSSSSSAHRPSHQVISPPLKLRD